MIHVVDEANKRVNALRDASKLTTGNVRSVSASIFKKLDDKSIDHVFTLCEQLLEERSWALWIIAYDWAFRVRNQYDEKTFDVFERWVKHYVRSWDDCDDFCTHALGELIRQDNALFSKVIKWTEHPDFWVRRAAAVSLIYPIKKGSYEGIDPFLVTDALLTDEHYLVLKGYGWMLKVLSQKEPQAVYAYLLNKKEVMPRLAFRYALEKLGKEMKENLMKD